MGGNGLGSGTMPDHQSDCDAQQHSGGQPQRYEVAVETDLFRRHVESGQGGGNEKDAQGGPASKRAAQSDECPETETKEESEAPGTKRHGMAGHHEAAFRILVTGQAEQGVHPIAQKNWTRRGQQDDHTRQPRNQQEDFAALTVRIA